MADLSKWISDEECKQISAEDQEWLESVFERFDGYPSLEDIWALMDETWRNLDCDPDVMDDRIDAYYSHPVWLLNGLFIEQHEQSLVNRRQFSDWVNSRSPKRVAEFGGGFGGLARMIGKQLQTVEVEVIEPHAHPLAIARAEQTTNVSYRPALSGNYDLMIATDVFEHVPDPLQLVADTAEHLRVGGEYLIANCFAPMILCHLPQTFHFSRSWDFVLKSMGLIPFKTVAYGKVFIRKGLLNLDAARSIERRSQALWPLTRNLPGRVARPLAKALFTFPEKTGF